MKKTIVFISALLAFGCQKQNSQPQKLNSVNESAVAAIQDSIKFDTLFPGEIQDGHNGKTVCILEGFEVIPHSVAYARAFYFTVVKSAGAHLTSARFFIDGETPRIVPVTGNKLIFNYTSRSVTVEEENLVGKHSIAMRITGDGARGEWYQVRLDSAIFIRKDPKFRITSTPLPQMGDKMIY